SGVVQKIALSSETVFVVEQDPDNIRGYRCTGTQACTKMPAIGAICSALVPNRGGVLVATNYGVSYCDDRACTDASAGLSGGRLYTSFVQPAGSAERPEPLAQAARLLVGTGGGRGILASTDGGRSFASA